MSNYAWVLEVRPGYEEEYKKRHDELWPEMKDMLREAGVRNYNIFRHGLTLFGYFETDDLKKSIEHGGASIKDFSSENGKRGSFQQFFKVYGREGERCSNTDCIKTIKRVVISNRASFFCSNCQK